MSQSSSDFLSDAIANFEETQENVLKRILRRNENTKFGVRHSLSKIRTLQEYRQNIPINEYEDLRQYVERQIEGEANCIVPKLPIMYVQTSGTSGAPKYLPLTEDTLLSYRRIQQSNTAIQSLMAPGIFSEFMLDIVSPMIEGRIKNEVDYGSMSGIVSETLPDAIKNKRIISRSIIELKDYDQKYFEIARTALQNSNITCLATANPSSFLKLMEVINKKLTELLEPLISSGIFSKKRADNLRLRQGNLKFSDLWPNLKGVVTWTSGNCGLLIPKVQELLSSETKILEMGYLASEFWGTMLVSPESNLCCPTIADNYFEFIPIDSFELGKRETIGLRDLELGKKYYIIVTTLDGLYRYFINDIVQVSGFYKGLPGIEFVQKGKGVTSLTGEKLYEGQAIQAIDEAFRIQDLQADFYILLADKETFSYFLYIESEGQIDLASLALLVDEQLSKVNLEYASKLGSGRLKPIQVKILRSGSFAAYKNHAVKSGQREAQFKALRLGYLDEVIFDFSSLEVK